MTFVDYARSVLYNSLADYDRAAEAAHHAARMNEVPNSTWALPELVEAAVRSGQRARAATAAERLSEIAAASPTYSARAAALARALVGDGDVAEDLYREAIEVLVGTRMASHLARTRLSRQTDNT